MCIRYRCYSLFYVLYYVGVLKVAMKILQTHYPELLKRTVFAHADVTFYCVFKVKEVEGRKEAGITYISILV